LEGTRTGKNICRDSITSDKAAATKAAMVTAGHCRRLRCTASASKKPKGA
jgi:hypothetical protein